MPKYQLIISEVNSKESSKEKSEVLNISFNDEASTNSQTVCLRDESGNINNDVEWKQSVQSVSFAKEIYKPSEVKVDFVLRAANLPTMTQVCTTFAGKKLDLTVDSKQVAQGYRIFNVKPKKTSDKGSMYLTIEAYSPDKYLTIECDSRAYTGKKLFENIIKGTSLELLKKQGCSDGIFVDNLLKYTFKTENGEVQTEYISPYLVQYNETDYDFLVRTLNRYGEYLYYEGANINVGLAAPSEKDVVSVLNYNSVEKSDVSTGVGKEAKYEVYPEVNDEFVEDFAGKAEDYVTLNDISEYNGAGSVGIVFKSLEEDNVVSMTEKAAMEYLIRLSGYGSTYETTKKGFREKFYNDVNFKAERLEKEDSKIFSYSSKENHKDGFRAFGSKHLQIIRQGIEEAEKTRHYIDLGNNFYDLPLGGLFLYELDSQGKADNAEKFITVKYTGKLVLGSGNDKSESYTLEGLKYNDDKNYPPYADVPRIRKAEHQRALVKDIIDPRRRGRVRVKFLWQGDDNITPWINISLPMASDNAGFNFLPEIGDMAIIGFEDGNVERPYVEGLIYSEEKKPGFSHAKSVYKSIVSSNGHSIIFNDSANYDMMLQQFIPFWSFCSKIAGTALPSGFAKIDDFKDRAKKSVGGITLRDEFGFYKVDLSSDRREVSIESTMGNVKLSAFTGITISAPNGNIKIEGKNVEIKARNDLKLSSGANVRFGNLKDSFLKRMGFEKETAAKVPVGVALSMFVDMNVWRTALETILRPVGGNTLIKSGRYLCLEAGMGKTSILTRDLSGSYYGRKTTGSTRMSNIHGEIEETIKFVNGCYSKVREVQSSLIRRKNRFVEAYNNLVNAAANDSDKFEDNSTLLDFNAVADKGYNNENFNKKEFKKTANVNKQCKSYLSDYNKHAKSIVEAISEYKKIFTAPKLLEGVIGTQEVGVKLIEDIINQYDNQVYTGADPYKLNTDPNNQPDAKRISDNMDAEVRKKMRILLAKVLDSRKDAYNMFKINLPAPAYDGNGPDDDNAWTDFVDGLTFNDASDDPKTSNEHARRFHDLILVPMGLDKLKDQYTWEALDRGRILFSDVENRTVAIRGEELQSYGKDRNSLVEDLKTLLKTI